ncbi:MAG: major facilitator superfamily 1 [Pseudonocardiales bacterium]|nr:major facilitator superfamily 1 [Pseudonocardiales bacterium]
MGTAMMATGLVTDFIAILATQMLWGLSWTFASGADIAWITDELDQPDRMTSVIVRLGRIQLLGSAAGIIALGLLASLIPRGTTMTLAGAGMVLLGFYVLTRFRELRFAPARSRRWAASRSVAADALRLARRNPVVRVVLVATLLTNGAHEYARLYQLRLIDVGFPARPLVWFTGLSVLMLLLGAVVLRIIERRVRDPATGRGCYVAGGTIAALGLSVFALAPDPTTATVAVVVVAATAEPIARTMSAIWVNENASGHVRATMHSLLAQSEYVGEIVCGAAITAVAAASGMTSALLLCASLFAASALVALRLRLTLA